jgi:general stress protein 13
MSETFKVGSIVSGKITGIQPYGAFVALDEDTQGLVHISEITNGYVKDINDYMKVGDVVKVKILSIDEQSGKIGLSIKAVEEFPQDRDETRNRRQRKRSAALASFPTEREISQGFNTLKVKLQEWIEQSQREDLIKNK